MTHNSYALAPSAGANQQVGLAGQLAAGVRAFMFDLHVLDPNAPPASRPGQQILLCHTACWILNAGSFVDHALRPLKTFLDANPDEVVVLHLENFSKFPMAEIASAFAQVPGLVDMVHVQPAGEHAWPTLGSMVATGRRIVVFVEGADQARVPYLLDMWTYMWDTPFSIPAGGPYTCTAGRPRAGAPGPRALAVLNHFVYVKLDLAGRRVDLPSSSDSAVANELDVLRGHLSLCMQQRPTVRMNFIAVDFFDLGDTLEFVAEQNGVALREPPNGSARVAGVRALPVVAAAALAVLAA